MNLDVVLASLGEELQEIAGLADERSAKVARRLSTATVSSTRLKLLDLLTQAAAELSSTLPSGHIELRLAGQQPDFVYVEAVADKPVADEDLSARISLRLPESLKTAVEKASTLQGVSTNTWLVRAIARATESVSTRNDGKRLIGYAQG